MSKSRYIQDISPVLPIKRVLLNFICCKAHCSTTAFRCLLKIIKYFSLQPKARLGDI